MGAQAISNFTKMHWPHEPLDVFMRSEPGFPKDEMKNAYPTRRRGRTAKEAYRALLAAKKKEKE